VVDLQGVDDWGSGSWFGGFRVMYVAMCSKAGVCILGCKVVSCVQCGEMC